MVLQWKIGIDMSLSQQEKLRHLEILSKYRREQLFVHPELRHLFLEMTIHCNEHCRHCGSECGDHKEEGRLTKQEIFSLLDHVKKEFPLDKFMLCITGGEPLLREDFFEIMDYANQLKLPWGMTSNGTLITEEIAHRLKQVGMRTISISVDGLKQSHEWFRQSIGSYDKTIQGIQNLLKEQFSHVQITTVVHAKNFHELDQMYEEFLKLGVRSWRVINIEPIGRAKEQPELLLSNEQYKQMFDFIVQHRNKGRMQVQYGCTHYLGLEYEREVRQWYFLCNAGIYTASIAYNGDIISCLDVERRPELVQGNIRKDCFKDIWENKFEIYRSDYRKVGKCASCEHYKYCQGDAFHSWNFDTMEPNICMKGILF